jgi:TRAP-type uncharacterized transport system substrate-binding protein
MAPRREERSKPATSRRRPGTTPEAREMQMIALATELAERQLRDGTASAQVISHFIKLGSSRERLEQARIERELSLMQMKEEEIASRQRVEELYSKALDAMRSYSGQTDGSSEIDYDD